MSKPMWIAVGVAISLVGAISVYALFTGKSAGAGPHGGDIVPIDKGAGYAELVANRESGEVMVYTWDKDLKTSRPVESNPLTIGRSEDRVDLEPHPMRGDPPGYSSRFYGQAEWMRGGGRHRGWLSLGTDGRREFDWSRGWDAGSAHGSMWEEMGDHRRMGPGMPVGEGRGGGHRGAR